jgi:hypothetical protein
MSDPKRLDAPNQQVVRADGSGPADEGEGGGQAPNQQQQLAADRPRPADQGEGAGHAPIPAPKAKKVEKVEKVKEDEGGIRDR